MKPSGMMPAARAAKIMCCLGMERRLGWFHAGLEREVFAADVHGRQARAGRGDRRHLEEGAGRLNHRDQARVPIAKTAGRFQAGNLVIDAPDVVGVLRLGDSNAIDIAADRRVEIEAARSRRRC